VLSGTVLFESSGRTLRQGEFRHFKVGVTLSVSNERYEAEHSWRTS